MRSKIVTVFAGSGLLGALWGNLSCRSILNTWYSTKTDKSAPEKPRRRFLFRVLEAGKVGWVGT